jgi:pheromone shutdown protein TraB
LAGKLVQDIHPTGVFVELDAKRVSGSGILAKRVSTDGANEGLQSRVIVPQIQVLASSLPTQQLRQAAGDAALSSSSYAQAPTTAQTTSQTTSQPNPMMRAASIAVGNSIKGMYKKLDSAGFQAGEEFVVAIREGQLIGSDIVLGDRDVEVTLRRLTEGLTQTDLRALLNPDSELEQSLKELVPPATARGSGSGTSEVASNTDEQLREEFSSFVEVIKTKENVRKIMFQLQKAAPALYEALVSERDAYMAAGLNGLNELETIVAVMGIAHVDGVEQNLKLNGWNAVNPSSCK